jgi:hypothetical protein
VKWSAGVMVVLYGWLELKSVPIGEIIGNLSGDLLTKIALSLYYLSWVAGLINDVDEQEEAYCKAPNQGRFPWKGGVLATLAIACVFALLCIVPSAKWFSIVLVLFLAINIAGYIYILVLIKHAITNSRKEYADRKDYNSLVKLKVVETYMTGRWQWYRFGYAIIAIGIIMAMSFSHLPQVLNSLYPDISPGTYVALSVLLYVITVEGWIWAMRIWTKIARGTVDFVFDNCPEGLKRSGT